MILDKKSIAGLIPSRRIKRTIARNLFEHIMKRGEVTVLYGARQVGKSTLILSCLEEYCNQGGNIFYFNLDYDLQDFITDPTEFIAYIESKKNTQNTMIFIDEAQRLENIGLFVKYIYDRKLQYKFILSGSASLDIQSKVKEPLTGRKKEFYLGSLTLSEILTFKGYNTEAITGSFPQLQTILEDYLLYGGYPQVFLSATKEDKVEKLEEISESYVLRDLSLLFDLNNERNITIITSFLAETIGNVTSIDNICKYTGISRHETEKILTALKKTCVINQIQPFYRDKAKEIIHAPKIYFTDNGIRNATLRKLEKEAILPDMGQLFENTVYTQLMSKFKRGTIHYWRTQNKTEVDFVIEPVYSQLIAYEIKYFYHKDHLPKNMKSFSTVYKDHIQEAAVIHSENYWRYLV